MGRHNQIESSQEPTILEAKIVLQPSLSDDNRMDGCWRVNISGKLYGQLITITNDWDSLKGAMPWICDQMIRAVEDVLHEKE